MTRRVFRYTSFFIILVVILIISILFSIALGTVQIPISEVFNIMITGDSNNSLHLIIVKEIRMPRTFAATIGGALLAVSGLFLQVFFRNPIVGPYVLGVSSGATLVVGLVILVGYTITASTTLSPYAIFMAAFLGALLVTFFISIVAPIIRSTITLLVIGLMISYICSAITNLLIAFAEKERVHAFILWTLGSFANYLWDQVSFTYIASIPLLLISIYSLKSLNALLLGEDYAKSMGVNIKYARLTVVVTASLLTALITGFAGPIAFIGLAVPHIARLLFKTSDVRVLFFASLLIGGIITVTCDTAARLALAPIELPISAVTSLFGAPIVIALLLKRRVVL